MEKMCTSAPSPTKNEALLQLNMTARMPRCQATSRQDSNKQQQQHLYMFCPVFYQGAAVSDNLTFIILKVWDILAGVIELLGPFIKLCSCCLRRRQGNGDN